MIRISNIKNDGRPASIIVRSYESSIVNTPEDVVKKAKDKLPNEGAQFRIKYKNKVPIEYTKNVSYEPKT